MLVIDPQITEMLNPREDTPLVKLTVDQLRLLEKVSHGMSDTAIAQDSPLEEQDVAQQLIEICQVLGVQLDSSINTRVAAVKAYIDQTHLI